MQIIFLHANFSKDTTAHSWNVQRWLLSLAQTHPGHHTHVLGEHPTPIHCYLHSNVLIKRFSEIRYVYWVRVRVGWVRARGLCRTREIFSSNLNSLQVSIPGAVHFVHRGIVTLEHIWLSVPVKVNDNTIANNVILYNLWQRFWAHIHETFLV